MADLIDIDIEKQTSEHLKKREALVAKEKELRHGEPSPNELRISSI